MGFFFEEKPAETPARVAPKRGRLADRPRQPGATGCDACSLKAQWPRITTPRMAAKGKIDGNILILGGNPGDAADRAGAPMDGTLDKMLIDLLPAFHRDDYVFQNVTRCHAGTLPVGPHESHACSRFLEDDMQDIDYVIGAGNIALHRFWPGASIARVHGVHFPIQVGKRSAWFFPVLDPAYVENVGGGIWTAPGTVLQSDLKRFFRIRETWGKPHVPIIDPAAVILPRSREEAEGWIAKMRTDMPLGVDVETGNRTGATLKPYTFDARILTGAISDGEITIAFPINHPEQVCEWGLDVLLDVMCTRQWVGHNSAFEWLWGTFFARGRELHAFDDSQALARLAFDRETIASLEDVSQAALGVNIKKLTNINAAMILEYTLAEVLPYNGLDALASQLIWRRMHKRVNPECYARMLDTIHTVSQMELHGLPVDMNESNRQKAEWTDKVADIEVRASKVFEVKQFVAATQRPFRLSANDDIGEALAVHGKVPLPKKVDSRGKVTYSTDDDSLQAVTREEKHPLIDCVKEYREAANALSNWIGNVQAVPGLYPDGKWHPAYKVMFTKTGRLSGDNGSAHNWPKRRNRQIRRQVPAPPGYLIVPIDYGQIEARVIAMASRDKFLCESIISGYDIHTAWRDKILNVYPDYYYRMAEMGKVDPKDEEATLKSGRNIIKTDFVFAAFFGSMAESIATRTGIPLKYVQQVFEEFWSTFSGVGMWIKQQRRIYKETGEIKTLTGRIRRGIEYGNEPLNTPIQGTAGDIMLDAMNDLRKIANELHDPAFMPRISIHDDLTFFIPDGQDAEAYIENITDEMTRVRYPWQIVPLMAEASIGENWADIKPVGEFVGDYRR